jgi:hypothetical protein
MFVLVATLLTFAILGVLALAVYTGSSMGGHAGPKSWSMRQVPGRHRLILVQ